MLVGSRDGHERSHSSHRGPGGKILKLRIILRKSRPLELVLLLVLLLHRVGLDLGGAGELEWLHQLV